MRSAAIEAAIAAGSPQAWLLTLSLPDGRQLRFSTVALAIEAGRVADGPYHFRPFLMGVEDYEEVIDLFGAEGAVALSSARAIIAEAADLAELASDWHHVAAATAELAITWPGVPWDHRIVVLLGSVQDCEWGGAGEDTDLYLEALPPPSSAVVGDATRDVGEDFAGTLDVAGDEMTDLSGARYQWVIGSPESVVAYKVGTADLAVAVDYLCLCGHAIPDVSSVPVAEDGASLANFAVSSSVANPSGTWSTVEHATNFAAERGAFTWSALLSGGIARSDAADSATKNAADVVRYLLSTSGLAVDYDRSLRALTMLESWKVGIWGDEEAAAIDVLRSDVLPYLPLVEIVAAEGVALEYLDPDQRPLEFDLVLGQHLHAVGRLRTTPISECANRLVVEYARDEYLGEFTATAIVDADTDAVCALSAQFIDTVAADPVECPIIWEAVTARRLARSLLHRRALSRRQLTCIVAPDLYWLRAGMAGAVSGGVLGSSRHRCIVTAIRRSSSMEVDLDLVDRTPAGAL